MEIEQAVLGAGLANPTSAQVIVTSLQKDDFSQARNQTVFEVLSEAVADGKPTDAVSIAARLGERSRSIGGPVYLAELFAVAAVPSGLDFQIGELKKRGQTRRLSLAGQRIQQLATQLDPDVALAESQTLLEGVVGDQASEAHRLGDRLSGTIERLDLFRQGQIPKGLDTGFTELDELTNGFQPGQMVIVAARPGVGKSTIAVDFMRHMSIRSQVPTLLYSLEMSADEVNQRILSAESGITLPKMRGGYLGDDDIRQLNAVSEQLSQAPLFIDDSPENTIAEIVAKTKIMVKRHGVKMVVVDYLQLLKSRGRVESRQQEVSGFSRQLKLLAKSEGIAVVAVAQLNRQSESRDGQVPKASDLRESGALEQDADIILLLNRPQVHDQDSERAGEVDVIVAKNRGGRMGKLTLADQLYKGCFASMGGI